MWTAWQLSHACLLCVCRVCLLGPVECQEPNSHGVSPVVHVRGLLLTACALSASTWLRCVAAWVLLGMSR
jgi:hypothetical protein